MRKTITFIFAAILIPALVAGCKASPTPAPSGSPSGSSSSSSSASSQPSTSAGPVKVGLAVITAMSKSADAGDKDGLAQVDSTVVAVLTDKEGKILKCAIDAVQAQVIFDKTGQLITPPETTFKTKNELGDDYGMKKASGIGKEWDEQASAFASFVEGMTVDEVKGIKVDEQNHPTESDLKSSVTISIGAFMEAIEKAVGMAQESGAAETDKLTLGIVTDMKKSSSAQSDKPGLVQVYSTFAVVTRDAGGKISACILDAAQSDIDFDEKGKILTDLSETPKTKNELGEEYGMKEKSAIKKEWNEQAAALAQYVTGKMPDEIKGIAVDEMGYAVSSDIKTSVTISIGGFMEALKKALPAG